MKSIDEQKIEKAIRIAELIAEQATSIAKSLNVELPDKERQQSALRAMVINDIELPLVIQAPLKRKEFAKGGVIDEKGPELFNSKN